MKRLLALAAGGVVTVCFLWQLIIELCVFIICETV
jgi:hypothetical protein